MTTGPPFLTCRIVPRYTHYMRLLTNPPRFLAGTSDRGMSSSRLSAKLPRPNAPSINPLRRNGYTSCHATARVAMGVWGIIGYGE